MFRPVPPPPVPAPPPPRPQIKLQFPRYSPTRERAELFYAGVVGEQVPIDVYSERRMIVSSPRCHGVAYCVVQAADNLKGIGIEAGDLLYVRSAYSRMRGSYHPAWRTGDVVIASVDGKAIAGELHRLGGQLRVVSRTGALPPLETSITIRPNQILGIVQCAEGT